MLTFWFKIVVATVLKSETMFDYIYMLIQDLELGGTNDSGS